MAASRPNHTAADQHYLDGISSGKLREFRDYMYSAAYMKDNATEFLDHNWIVIPVLREFLAQNNPNTAVAAASTSIRVKIDDPGRALPPPNTLTLALKTEASVPSINASSAAPRVLVSYEGGQEILELLSDSDADDVISGRSRRLLSGGLLVPQVSLRRRRWNSTNPTTRLCLGIKKIKDWWDHKGMHVYLIPCLVKSQSRNAADVWDRTPSTTNTNEAQHHWTNSLTGIKLTCVEAIESARVVDQNIAAEIETSMQTAILTNANNEVANRMSCNVQCQSAVAHKSRESQAKSEEEKRIAAELALKAVKSSSKKGKSTSGAILSASSSGRVKSAPPRKQKTPVAPVDMSDPQETETNLQTDALSTNACESQGTVNETASVHPDPSTGNMSESQGTTFIQPDDTPDVLAAWMHTVSGTAVLPGVDTHQSQLVGASSAIPFSQYGPSHGFNSDFCTSAFMNSTTSYGLDPEFYAPALMTPASQMFEQLPAFAPTSDDGLFNFTDSELAVFLGLSSNSNSASTSEAYASSSRYSIVDSSFNSDSSLPRLPPPPPESPPDDQMSLLEPLRAPTPPRSRRPRLDGLEPVNILAAGSSRSRGASTRKHDAEDQQSKQAKKRKTRGGQV